MNKEVTMNDLVKAINNSRSLSYMLNKDKEESHNKQNRIEDFGTADEKIQYISKLRNIDGLSYNDPLEVLTHKYSPRYSYDELRNADIRALIEEHSFPWIVSFFRCAISTIVEAHTTYTGNYLDGSTRRAVSFSDVKRDIDKIFSSVQSSALQRITNHFLKYEKENFVELVALEEEKLKYELLTMDPYDLDQLLHEDNKTILSQLPHDNYEKASKILDNVRFICEWWTLPEYIKSDKNWYDSKKDIVEGESAFDIDPKDDDLLIDAIRDTREDAKSSGNASGGKKSSPKKSVIDDCGRVFDSCEECAAYYNKSNGWVSRKIKAGIFKKS